ncbi:PREDICTED: uncharacterized protein LOC104806242 [Tarenaya hassleriana]|uniref:uncharacterized protein LOC104806242 n=1 Tax=Tarenaya hassleriana TaxID=28532 RepID=UPI00053C5060|nr:PREDICTED: uncharacterized protein LOC104806242 [Tarenaya hassleriana]
MTMPRAYLHLLVLTTFVLILLGASPSICSRAKLSSESASADKLKEEFPAPAWLVSRGEKDHTSVSDSSSLKGFKVDPANTMVAGFFKSRFPFPGWPFPKYPPVPFMKPTFPSVPTTPGAEQSEKLPSPPSPGKDNGSAGNP